MNFRHLPNFITLLNLFSGSIAIIMAFEGNLSTASYFIGIAVVFDFFDGFLARLLKAYSDIGKELDSLADIVSFGVAPSIIMFHLLKLSLNIDKFPLSFDITTLVDIVVLLSAFLITVFSALRLAKFNVDKRQKDTFIGLPTPASAILIASLPVIMYNSDNFLIKQVILSIYFLVPLIIFLSFLLVAEFPMFSLKFKSINFTNNKIPYIFIGISVILLIILQYLAIPIIIIFYIVLSAVNNWQRKVKSIK